MKGIVETVAGVIERLSISSTEKKRLKQELETLLVDYEREHLQVQSGVLRSEAQGNWLQRSWRPVIMLAFTVVILVGMFTDLPMPEDTSPVLGFAGNRIGRIYRRPFPDEKVINFIIVNYGNLETSFGGWWRAASGLPEKQPEAVRSRYDCGALHGRDKCTHGSRVPGKRRK